MIKRWCMILSELIRQQEKTLRISISMEILHPLFFAKKRLRLLPDQYLHHTEFCCSRKSSSCFLQCMLNKERSKRLAARGKAFSGCCVFGRWEYALPVMVAGELGAILYYGNARTEIGDTNSSGGREVVSEERKLEIRRAAAFIRDFIGYEFQFIRDSGPGLLKRQSVNFYVENARDFIDLHYSENIALADLADMLNVNPNYLGSVLKHETKRSFRELLNERRCRESLIYLRHHRTLSIGRISMLCGFQDSNYFSVVFRKYYGTTPSEYRRSTT